MIIYRGTSHPCQGAVLVSRELCRCKENYIRIMT